MVSVDDDPIPIVRPKLVYIFVILKYLLHGKKEKTHKNYRKHKGKVLQIKLALHKRFYLNLKMKINNGNRGIPKVISSAVRRNRSFWEKNVCNGKPRNLQYNKRGKKKCKFLN